MKLFDKIATNIKLCHTDKMTLMDFDEILGKSITAFNRENGYLDVDEQLKLKRPLQARGIY
jgi:hypothetical protein